MAKKTTTEQYGILIYDIPTENMKLYMKVYTAIRRRAVQLNKSVYLIQWGMRERLQQIIDEAVAETGQQLVAQFLPFDKHANDHIEDMALLALRNDIKNIVERIKTKIEQVGIDEPKYHDAKCFKKVENQLKETHAIALTFGFADDIEQVLVQARKTIDLITTLNDRRCPVA